jgi:hypothetical protein
MRLHAEERSLIEGQQGRNPNYHQERRRFHNSIVVRAIIYKERYTAFYSHGADDVGKTRGPELGTAPQPLHASGLGDRPEENVVWAPIGWRPRLDQIFTDGRAAWPG